METDELAGAATRPAVYDGEAAAGAAVRRHGVADDSLYGRVCVEFVLRTDPLLVSEASCSSNGPDNVGRNEKGRE